MFNKYYQDELAYLRELGREFAQTYPQLAPMLADRGGDPDVERLLEGVAFLTGRVRQKLDDELPEAMHAISNLLFPHLLRPLPSATIMELSPLQHALRERIRIPAGTEFGSISVDGTSCKFTSTSHCDLVPWTIDDVRVEMLPGGRQQLRIEMIVPVGMPIAHIAPEFTRFHFAGETRQALTLLMWCFTHLEDVVLIESKPAGGQERELSLGKGALRPVGFSDEDRLLPFDHSAFVGFRLLQEYYALPSKFAFIDVAGLGRAGELRSDLTRFAIALRFDAPLADTGRLTKEALRLHCVPAVNIFATTAEPIRVTPTREQFMVRPAGIPNQHAEVYAIRKVEGIIRGAAQRMPIPSFFEFSHGSSGSSQERFFYATHHVPSVIYEGADVHVSFGTAEDVGAWLQADVVSIDILATNRRLASALRVGEINAPTANSPAIATFRNLSATTSHVPAPVGRDLQWRVVSHAAMSLRSLAEPEVLRAVLSVYNFHALVDRQAARANELRVNALKDVRVSPVERLYRGAPVRGVDLQIDLEETGFAGEGDMFLFASILERFFAEYVSLNSFTQTAVVGTTSKVRFSWPPRSGNQTIL